ncbi:MAG: T9SS type A sorting domain-containing protein, partial [Bacteroidota bacterium]|nr:T9SS type A sorting domain-containing protein [Bacteroidota bacterium]
ADSLDVTQTYNPSLFTFDNNSQSWNPVLNSAGTLTAGSPFRLMVRGSRAVDLNNNDAAPSNTIIRATGALTTGTSTVSSVLSKKVGGYSFVGNPYACPVNWLTLAKSGISSSYYTFDESIGRHGTYVTYNGLAQTNDQPSSSVNENIQSGQAFFVQSTSIAPSITFTESNKTYTNTSVFRSTNSMAKLSVQLLLNLDGGGSNTADGVVVVYSDAFSRAVGDEDSYKFTNLDESVAINRDGVPLSIEGRPNIIDFDTIPLKIWQYRQKEYWIRLDAKNFSPEISITFKDNFLQTTTPVSLSSATTIPFIITADSASFAPNRFSIVLSPSITLPLILTTVKAAQQEKGIQVEWETAVDANIERYEVEKSFNGQPFNKVFATTAKIENALRHTYSFLDINAAKGANFYRIKIIEKTSNVRHSEVVRVNIADSKRRITVYPNPIKGNTISLQMTNIEEGEYSVTITNISGQVVYSTSLMHMADTFNETISLKQKIAAGKYTLQISNDKTAINKPIIVQ